MKLPIARHWRLLAVIAGSILTTMPAQSAPPVQSATVLPIHKLAVEHFGNDAPWYESNIPFFDCSDPELTQIYYYRWKLYKAHLRDLGSHGYIVTEFLDDVGWAKWPYQSLNDATGFHIYEGRWLKDRRYVDNYIDYMYSGGGNDRHFSEAIADAVWADYLATGDRAFATKHVDSMQHIFNLWDDHFDFGKGLYYIMPLLDATEYSIASIEASGGKDGFWGGEAFRPTINSYMYADALAIANLAALNWDESTARLYRERASKIRKAVEQSLWSDNLQHFIDRFQVNNEYVKYWNPIDGRELAGYSPWYFNLPDHDPKYAASWRHILSPQELGGPYGIRTAEPSFKYYMKQYRYDKPTGNPECQWNGPSWPFQTTQALVGMANLLNNYKQSVVTQEDYVRLLRQYAHQHYRNGAPDLQEDYNADTGNVIVGLPRSHHYNHSDFDDLIITGLAGLRPRSDNTLEVDPLVAANGKSPNAISYFCLDSVPYHGHLVTILYDHDGERYHKGAGLSVYIDGRLALRSSPLGKKTIPIAPPQVKPVAAPVDIAVNLPRFGYPAPSASVNPADVYGAVDGRVWYFDNVHNGWTTTGSQNKTDWYAIDFGAPQTIRSARLYFYADGKVFAAPARCNLQYGTGSTWVDAAGSRSPKAPIANGENVVEFAKPIRTQKLRAVFARPVKGSIDLVELKVY
jgi:hypothetical protein